jgi:hypothetical protein
MVPTRVQNSGRLGAAAQRSSFPSSSGSQIVQNMPLACDSTSRAIFVRTSDRGDPAKINFCRLRTVTIENRPEWSSGGPRRDDAFSGVSISLSMNGPSTLLDSAIRVLVTTRRKKTQGRRGTWRSPWKPERNDPPPSGDDRWRCPRSRHRGSLESRTKCLRTSDNNSADSAARTLSDKATRPFSPATQSYSLSFRRSHALTVFVGSIASAPICISTTFPFLSMR